MSDHIGIAPNRIRFGASGSGGRRQVPGEVASLAEAAGGAACGHDKHLQADPPRRLQPKPSAPKTVYRTRTRHTELAALSVRSDYQAGSRRSAGASVRRFPGGARTVIPGPHGGAGWARSEDELFGVQWPSGGLARGLARHHRAAHCRPDFCPVNRRRVPRRRHLRPRGRRARPLPSTSSGPKPSRPVTEGTRPDSHDQQGENTRIPRRRTTWALAAGAVLPPSASAAAVISQGRGCSSARD